LTACGNPAKEKSSEGTTKQNESSQDGVPGENGEDITVSDDVDEVEPADENESLELDETDDTWFTEEGDADFINE